MRQTVFYLAILRLFAPSYLWTEGLQVTQEFLICLLFLCFSYLP